MTKKFGNIEPHFLLRVLKNEVTDEEREFFYQWLESRDENKEEFGQIALLWDKTAKLPTPLSPDLNLEWNKFQIKLLESIIAEKQKVTPQKLELDKRKRINHYNKDKNIYFSNRIQKYVIFTRAAAILLISFLVYWILNQPIPVKKIDNTEQIKFYEFVTRRGEKATIPLSDGSTVYLNAESKLIYPQFFDNKKKIFETRR